MAAVGIIGAGTWGTALAVLLNNNGHDVTIWSAFDTEIQEMSRTRRHKNLPEVVLPDQIQMTADLRTAMAEKDMLIMAVPSVYVRSTAAKMKEYLRYGQIVVDVAKGIEEATLMTLTDILEEELPGEAEDDYKTLGGFITYLFGYIPKETEKISFGHFTFEVMDCDNRRVDKVLVTEGEG